MIGRLWLRCTRYLNSLRPHSLCGNLHQCVKLARFLQQPGQGPSQPGSRPDTAELLLDRQRFNFTTLARHRQLHTPQGVKHRVCLYPCAATAARSTHNQPPTLLLQTPSPCGLMQGTTLTVCSNPVTVQRVIQYCYTTTHPTHSYQCMPAAFACCSSSLST